MSQHASPSDAGGAQRTVGGFMPAAQHHHSHAAGGRAPSPLLANASASGSGPRLDEVSVVGPPATFAVDAVDSAASAGHHHHHQGGPIQSAASPLISRRRSQSGTQASPPPPPTGGGPGDAVGAVDPYADLRASRAALVTQAQPGRLSYAPPSSMSGGVFASSFDVPRIASEGGAGAGRYAAVDLDDSGVILSGTQGGVLLSSPDTLTGRSPAREDADDDDGYSDADDCVDEVVKPLPMLPAGRVLLINCLTNWGDPHAIGLTGVEVFDAFGDPLNIRPEHVFGMPEPLQTGAHAPGRVVVRPHSTTDDDKMWLVPYTKGENHVVALVLPRERTAVSVIRVWNYNNGRVHTSRGARLVEITLDEQLVFRGELRRASGSAAAGSETENCETFILTDDVAALGRVAAFLDESTRLDATHAARDDGDDSAVVGGDSYAPSAFATIPSSSTTSAGESGSAAAPLCSSVSLEFHDTWGDGVVVGLSAVRVIDAATGDAVLDVTAALEVPGEYAELFAAASEENSLQDGSTPLAALLDDDPGTAWFARLVPGLTLRLDFPRPVAVAAVQVANAGVIDTSCGARTVTLRRDRSTTVAEGLVLRKATAALPTLLFQTLRLSDLLASSAAGATVAMSVEARAAVGLRRAMMLQRPWPTWYEAVAPDVGLLPVGYTFALRIRIVPAVNQLDGGGSEHDRSPLNRTAAPATLEVLRCAFLDADDGRHSDRFTATVPPTPAGDVRRFESGGELDMVSTVVVAFDDPKCLEGVALTFRGVAPGCCAEAIVLVDDMPVFQTTFSGVGGVDAAAADVVIPMTRQPEFLDRHRDRLLRAE